MAPASTQPGEKLTIGFTRVMVPDPEDRPLEVAIWHPSSGPTSSKPLGPFTQVVVPDGPVTGAHLPLILVSEGAFGSPWSHYDTALELARAGFVVAAVMHTGDNYRDQSYAGNRRDLIGRPRQMHRVTDYMLGSWPARAQLDPARVGIFGFSLGGFTALVEIGGIPDLRQMARLCADHADAPECRFIRDRHGDQLDPMPASEPKWVHDARIRAAVIVAPAVAFLFEPDGLRLVKVPVQLWHAEGDEQSPNRWNSDVVRELLHVSEEHTAPGTGHYAFLAPCNAALASAVPAICEDAPGFDRSAFHRDFDNEVIAFFKARLDEGRVSGASSSR
jgi:predicted dienelactone hydrolase